VAAPVPRTDRLRHVEGERLLRERRYRDALRCVGRGERQAHAVPILAGLLRDDRVLYEADARSVERGVVDAPPGRAGNEVAHFDDPVPRPVGAQVARQRLRLLLALRGELLELAPHELELARDLAPLAPDAQLLLREGGELVP